MVLNLGMIYSIYALRGMGLGFANGQNSKNFVSFGNNSLIGIFNQSFIWGFWEGFRKTGRMFLSD